MDRRFASMTFWVEASSAFGGSAACTGYAGKNNNAGGGETWQAGKDMLQNPNFVSAKVEFVGQAFCFRSRF